MSGSDHTAQPDALIRTEDGRNYWEGVGADVNGMLGGVTSVAGFSNISKVDLQGSRSFLAKLGIGSKNGRRIVANALEGGAGIGRVTEGLLADVAEQMDVIEPVANFTKTLQAKKGVRNVFSVGLEDWMPEQGILYDLIWTQWCVGYLNDEQLLQYLERCREVLKPDGGLIIVKENLTTSGVDLFDEADSSVTREDGKFQTIFQQAGLRIVKSEIQKGFPKTFPRRLFPVKMYALKPKSKM
ncbi:alpha-N-methyltransferase NTM1 [Pseudomassariella vexata]|uniref:Alpha N-terminal protein methyltransferase 1 n=1 Tax=Pseudomassariella vexata TaxID=1141098 RepID=A0A1Y2DQP4_9PEZI|nr:alpha-N-methyltransferase NTM1 [Pseudomassariella vexata]ORY61623.1 alpha-N-methyltransferase NTM1 [Pseudomassariella vexata]